MQSEGIRVKPVGGMDSDSDFLDIKDGNYVRAHNISTVTSEGNTGFSIKDIKGNTQIVSIPPIIDQGKKFEIYIDQSALLTGTESHTIKIYTSNAALITTFSFNVDSSSITTTVSNFNTAFNAAMAALTYSAITTSGTYNASTGYYTFLINQLGYSDYNVYSEPPSNNKSIVSVIVLQESIPPVISGLLRPIAFREMGEDVFVLSTTRDNDETVLPVNITSATNATPIVLTFSANHGLITGTKIKVKNVLGNTAANGVFTVNFVSLTQVSLNNSSGNGSFVSSPNAQVQYNIEGVGQIGVLKYDDNLLTWTYTALMTSKQLELIAEHQPDLKAEDNINRKSIYWADGRGLTRCFYYRGAYFNEGAYFHPFLNKSGFYRRETVFLETQLIISNINVDIAITEVKQSGGQLPAGNIVYWVTFLNDAGTRTDYIGPIGPVNIYKAAYNNPDSDAEARQITGSKELETTPKAVVLNINNIPNAFQYIQVHYAVASGNGTFLKSGSLPRQILGERTQIEITHTGTEQETEFIVSEASVKKPNYGSARHIDTLDNRLIISNVSIGKKTDFSDWFATWKHSLKYYEQENVISTNPSTITSIALRIRENMVETNVLNYRGYMLMERYRFYGVCEFYNGSTSDAFWIDDIVFDTGTYPRRTQTLPNLSLKGTNTFTNKHRVPYVEFHGFDTEYVIDGTPIWQLVKRVHIYRCEVTNKQVQGSGLMVPCVNSLFISPALSPIYYINGSTFGVIGEYPFVFCESPTSGFLPMQGPYVGYPDGNSFNAASLSANRRYAAFYSFDAMYGQNKWSVLPGDFILNLGQGAINLAPQIVASNNFVVAMTHEDNYSSNISSPTPSKILVEDGIYLNEGEAGEINSVKVSKQFAYGVLSERVKNRPSGYMVRTATDVNGYLSVATDFGFYNAIYYRELTANAQYGDIFEGMCVPTGAILNIENLKTKVVPDVVGTFAPGVFQVFGGDCFTHTAFLKVNSPGVEITSTNNGDENNGLVIYTCQSRINYLMRSVDDFGVEPYPKHATIANFLQIQENDTTFYNKSYSAEKIFDILKMRAYNPNRETREKEPTMIAYSAKKVAGSALDSYRYFAPLDFVLMDYSDGPILGQRIANKQLYTWQPRKMLQHYFNSDGVFISKDGSEVILGTGAVMSRRARDISVFGCSNQWSIIKGKSAGGNDVLYWVNSIYKKVIRFGFDGTVVIADIHFQDFTFRDGIQWSVLEDNPVLCKGVMGVWDQRYKQAKWNFIGRRSVNAYNPLTTYFIGQSVLYTGGGYLGPYPIGEIYKSKVNSNLGNTPPAPGVSDNFWEYVPYTDTDFYSFFSIVFNEKTNSFTSFNTVDGNLLGEWRDTYIGTNPKDADKNKLYLADSGSFLSWFSGEIEEEGHVEFVVNKYPDTTKRFQAIMIKSSVPPYRVEFRTENHYTFLLAADFEKIEDGYWSPIKNDANITVTNPQGRNDIDTSPLWGRYLLVKIFFEVGVQQSVNHIVIKAQRQHRTVNQ